MYGVYGIIFITSIHLYVRFNVVPHIALPCAGDDVTVLEAMSLEPCDLEKNQLAAGAGSRAVPPF